MHENIKLIVNKKKYNISNIIELDSNNTIYNYPKPKPFNLYVYIHLFSKKIIIYLLILALFYFIFHLIFNS
jgi:hypothetical protein